MGGDQSEESDVSRGVRCQLLEWFSNENVFIGEGEFCSCDLVYKIGGIPLGPNVAAVIVKTVIEKESPLWRPTPTMVSLGEVVGFKILWLVEKVILDEIVSPSTNNVSDSKGIDSDESQQRCKIYDWNVHGEVIAEGVLCSTNPKQMINNIPLGPNAAIVKVNLVLKETVYLWRPTAELFLMADVLHADIAWPIEKIEIINENAGEDSVRR